MKTKMKVALFCGLMLFASGCKKDDDNGKGDGAGLRGNVISAPEWNEAEGDEDYPSSMTAVVLVDLLQNYPDSGWEVSEDDRLAAFVDGECCASGTLVDGLFILYIGGLEDKPLTGKMVTLKYYSAYYRNIFVAEDAFEFRNDNFWGSVNNPMTPELRLE